LVHAVCMYSVCTEYSVWLQLHCQGRGAPWPCMHLIRASSGPSLGMPSLSYSMQLSSHCACDGTAVGHRIVSGSHVVPMTRPCFLRLHRHRKARWDDGQVEALSARGLRKCFWRALHGLISSQHCRPAQASCRRPRQSIALKRHATI